MGYNHHQVNSALHPSGVVKSSTSFGWGERGKVSAARWQVTLCDPLWHVISRSGEVIPITNQWRKNIVALTCSAALLKRGYRNYCHHHHHHHQQQQQQLLTQDVDRNDFFVVLMSSLAQISACVKSLHVMNHQIACKIYTETH